MAKGKPVLKEKKHRLLVASLITFGLAALGLGSGFYMGFATINYNYITIGTMNNSIMYLFLCSGLLIALGVVAVSVALKLFSLKNTTHFVFYMKKGIIISSMVYYSLVAIVGVLSMIFGFVSVAGSPYSFVIFVLAGVAAGLSVLCFIIVFKTYKRFMKRIKNGEIKIEIEYPKKYRPAEDASSVKAYAKNVYKSDAVSVDGLQSELVRLDEMRGRGLISTEEYQELKSHWLSRMNNKIF